MWGKAFVRTSKCIAWQVCRAWAWCLAWGCAGLRGAMQVKRWKGASKDLIFDDRYTIHTTLQTRGAEINSGWACQLWVCPWSLAWLCNRASRLNLRPRRRQHNDRPPCHDWVVDQLHGCIMTTGPPASCHQEYELRPRGQKRSQFCFLFHVLLVCEWFANICYRIMIVALQVQKKLTFELDRVVLVQDGLPLIIPQVSPNAFWWSFAQAPWTTPCSTALERWGRCLWHFVTCDMNR